MSDSASPCPDPQVNSTTAAEARKQAGMARAARRREKHIAAARVRFLDAILRHPQRIATTDDVVDDLREVYPDGGKWLGSVPKGLAHDGVIKPIGYEKSRRISRNSTPVSRWQACVSDDVIRAHRAQLQAMVDEPEPEPEPPVAAPKAKPAGKCEQGVLFANPPHARLPD